MNLNKALIIGNLTRDPEVRTTPTGQTVASFGVATNRRWKDQSTGERKEQVEYHNIVCWRRLAEIVSQYLKKGSKVYIEGRLQTRNWEGQDGVKRYRTEIIAENMIMLDRPGAQGAGTMSSDKKTESIDETAQPEPSSSEEEVNVEDIPF